MTNMLWDAKQSSKNVHVVSSRPFGTTRTLAPRSTPRRRISIVVANVCTPQVSVVFTGTLTNVYAVNITRRGAERVPPDCTSTLRLYFSPFRVHLLVKALLRGVARPTTYVFDSGGPLCDVLAGTLAGLSVASRLEFQ